MDVASQDRQRRLPGQEKTGLGISNKPKVMGNYVNKKSVNYVTVTAAGVLTFLSLALVNSAF